MERIYNFRNFNKVFEINTDNPFLSIESSFEGDFHQAILDVGYNWWQKNNGASYSDMVEYMEKEFGYKFALLILLGKYNQQVGNGGLIQYFDNQYASYGSKGDNNELHMMMIDWFEDAELDNTKNGKRVLKNLKDSGDIFDKMLGGSIDCGDCDNGEVEEDCYECENGQILDTCSNCGGEGEIEIDEDEYEDCPDCDEGEVEIECPHCDDGRTYNSCEYCDGSGHLDPSQAFSDELEVLSKKYFTIDYWEDNLNDFSKKIIIEKYPNFEKDLAVKGKTTKYNL